MCTSSTIRYSAASAHILFVIQPNVLFIKPIYSNVHLSHGIRVTSRTFAELGKTTSISTSRALLKSPRGNLGGILSRRICPRRLRIAYRLYNTRLPKYHPPARRRQKSARGALPPRRIRALPRAFGRRGHRTRYLGERVVTRQR
jgi:hypothetical protein